MASLSKRLTAEIVGTFGFFFMGFSGIAAATEHPQALGPVGVAAGFGLGLALMIGALGHISGGHFNPAVTAALIASKRFPLQDLIPYWAAQVIGGMAAGALAKLVYSSQSIDSLVNNPTDGVGNGTTFVLEAVVTFLFVLVIITVAADKKAPWSGVLAPVLIGGFIFTAATVIGPFTSGSFNPARSLAPALVDSSYDNLWIYIMAPLVGGVVGGLFSLLLNKDEEQLVID